MDVLEERLRHSGNPNVCADEYSASPNEALELIAEIRRLRKGLAFYAVHSTYEEGVPLPGHLNGPVPIDADKGTQARKALGHWATLNLYWREVQ